jgi:2-hydroxy-3-keto-5-methylthiopentenyl-1-phosphate phosphatase
VFNNKQPVIFCDFDGTITDKDVIMMVMEKFAPPEWHAIVDDIMLHRSLSIKEGVQALFHLLESSQKAEIIDFVLKTVRLRQGFEAFLLFCQQQHIPFIVVSGGVDFFITPILEPYKNQLQIFCNQGDFSSPRIRLTMPYLKEDCTACGQCAVCKISILELYPSEAYYRIAIGDSITDLGMTHVADQTFARSKLVTYMREIGKEPLLFETFHDIQRVLEAGVRNKMIHAH